MGFSITEDINGNTAEYSIKIDQILLKPLILKFLSS